MECQFGRVNRDNFVKDGNKTSMRSQNLVFFGFFKFIWCASATRGYVCGDMCDFFVVGEEGRLPYIKVLKS